MPIRSPLGPAPWPSQLQSLVEEALDRLLPGLGTPPQTLHRAMRDAVFAGGKRLRPLFLLRTAQACRVRPAAQELALRAACAVELVHVASLVHDDLPCFDDRAERHGRPTVYALFGEAQALQVGDALIACAFDVLVGAQCAVAARTLRLVQLLARASGSRSGLSGGPGLEQHGCAYPSSPERAERYHELKTGALFALSGEAAAVIAAAPQPAAWAELGWQVGSAYQLAHTLTTRPPAAGLLCGPDPAPASTRPWLVPGCTDALTLARIRELATAAHERIASLAADPQPLHAFVDEQCRALGLPAWPLGAPGERTERVSPIGSDGHEQPNSASAAK